MYTQGHFFCTKCGRKHHSGRTFRRSRSSKAGKFIGILVVIVFGLIALPIGMNYFGIPISLDILQPIIPAGRNLEINLDEGFVVEQNEEIKQKETVPEITPPKTKEPDNFIAELSRSITPKSLNITEIEQKIHELINVERTKNGLKSLSMNPTLSNIARQHSQDMATRGYFEHDSPEGKDFEGRYKENNFNCEIKVSESTTETGAGSTTTTTYATGAENISFLEGYSGEDRIAKVMVDGWMNSPGHRKNILTEFFQNEGIGITKLGNKIYGTQNFC